MIVSRETIISKVVKNMFANILSGFGNMIAEVTPIITSSDWDTLSETATTTGKAAIAPALAVLTITVGAAVAKKVFKRVSN